MPPLLINALLVILPTLFRPTERAPRRCPRRRDILVISWSVLLLATSAKPAASAQTGPTLHARSRIRLMVFGQSTPFVGRLTFMDSDTITVRIHSRLVRVSWSRVRSLAVSRGAHPGLRYGAPVLGAGIGAVVGNNLFPESDRCRTVPDLADECDRILSDAVIGAAWGAVAFAIGTNAIARERWENVPLEPLLRADGSRRQLRIGLTVRW